MQLARSKHKDNNSKFFEIFSQTGYFHQTKRGHEWPFFLLSAIYFMFSRFPIFPTTWLPTAKCVRWKKLQLHIQEKISLVRLFVNFPPFHRFALSYTGPQHYSCIFYPLSRNYEHSALLYVLWQCIKKICVSYDSMMQNRKKGLREKTRLNLHGAGWRRAFFNVLWQLVYFWILMHLALNERILFGLSDERDGTSKPACCISLEFPLRRIVEMRQRR